MFCPEIQQNYMSILSYGCVALSCLSDAGKPKTTVFCYWKCHLIRLRRTSACRVWRNCSDELSRSSL